MKLVAYVILFLDACAIRAAPAPVPAPTPAFLANIKHDLPVAYNGSESHYLASREDSHDPKIYCQVKDRILFWKQFHIEGHDWDPVLLAGDTKKSNAKNSKNKKMQQAGNGLKHELEQCFFLHGWKFTIMDSNNNDKGKQRFRAQGRYVRLDTRKSPTDERRCPQEAVVRAGGPASGCDWCSYVGAPECPSKEETNYMPNYPDPDGAEYYVRPKESWASGGRFSPEGESGIGIGEDGFDG